MKKIISLFFTGFLLIIFKNYIIIESFIIASVVFFTTQKIKKELKNHLKEYNENNNDNNNIILKQDKNKEKEINYLKELKKELVEINVKDKQKVYKK